MFSFSQNVLQQSRSAKGFGKVHAKRCQQGDYEQHKSSAEAAGWVPGEED